MPQEHCEYSFLKHEESPWREEDLRRWHRQSGARKQRPQPSTTRNVSNRALCRLAIQQRGFQDLNPILGVELLIFSQLRLDQIGLERYRRHLANAQLPPTTRRRRLYT